MRIDTRTVAVVTGGADGIGRATALALQRRGASVALIDIDAIGLAQAGEDIPGCSTHVCDVADRSAVSAAIDNVVSTHGGVNLLVNVAGIAVAGTFESVPRSAFERVMNVNFWGTVNCCGEMLPHLRKTASHGEAAICNVLSDFALLSVPTKSAYASSKHAARAFTESLAAELFGTGIAVTAVYPGATATALVTRGYASDEVARARESRILARGMPASLVAARIVQAIERGQSRVLIGADARVIALALRIAPNTLQRLLRHFWRRLPFV